MAIPPQPPARPAQPPHPATPPPPPPNRPAPGATPAHDPQEAKLTPYELAATRAQDEPVVTIAQEQRERSEAMQQEGIERYKARGDDRDPRDRPRTVPGVSPTET